MAKCYAVFWNIELHIGTRRVNGRQHLVSLAAKGLASQDVMKGDRVFLLARLGELIYLVSELTVDSVLSDCLVSGAATTAISFDVILGSVTPSALKIPRRKLLCALNSQLAEQITREAGSVHASGNSRRKHLTAA